MWSLSRHLKNEHDLPILSILLGASSLLHGKTRLLWSQESSLNISISRNTFINWLLKIDRPSFENHFLVVVALDNLRLNMNSIETKLPYCDVITGFQRKISNVSLQTLKQQLWCENTKSYQLFRAKNEVLSLKDFHTQLVSNEKTSTQHNLNKFERINSALEVFQLNLNDSNDFSLHKPLNEENKPKDEIWIYSPWIDKNASSKGDVKSVCNELLPEQPFVITYTDLGLLSVLWNIHFASGISTKFIPAPDLWHWKYHILKAIWPLSPITHEIHVPTDPNQFFEVADRYVVSSTYVLKEYSKKFSS